MARGSTARDRRVAGHQLALLAVAGEAHDDDPAGLDAGDDALTERRVDDVVAEPEGLVLGLRSLAAATRPRARAGPRRQPRPRPLGGRAGIARRGPPASERALAVQEVRRQLSEEAAREAVARGPEDRAASCV